MILKPNITPLLQGPSDSIPTILSASITEKPGEKYSPNFLTFYYPGRESLTIEAFLASRPEIRDFYIYDVNLTTGRLLYSCAGGIGVTKERNIIEMHKAINIPTFSQAIEDRFRNIFGENFSRAKYLTFRKQFNDRGANINSVSACAELYLLWVASGFTHRYKNTGYEGLYFPTTFDTELIKQSSILSREKNLLFRREDFFTLSESIINDNVIIYCHLSHEFGIYGAGFNWSIHKLKYFAEILNDFNKFGYKVCVSALHERRGRIFRDITDFFPKFDSLIVPQFKATKLGLEFNASDIYLFNF